MSVVFMEVRGFTSLSERLPLAEVAPASTDFTRLLLTQCLNWTGPSPRRSVIRQWRFSECRSGRRSCPRAVTAALWIVKTLEDMIDDDESLRVGGGVGNGEAFIGNVAEGEVRDFTVIGDIVNTAARLQSLAELGEVMIMEETHRWLTGKHPEASQSSC